MYGNRKKKKTRVFCNFVPLFVTLWQSAPNDGCSCRHIFTIYYRFSCSFLHFSEHETAFLTACINEVCRQVAPQFWRKFAKLSEIFKNFPEKFVLTTSTIQRQPINIIPPALSNLARRRWPQISYSLPKLKIFGGHLGEFRPRKPKKLHNNLGNARKIFIFASCRRIPLQKIMKRTMLMLLYGLNLCFNFGKIRFINDRFIQKKFSD